MRALKTRLARRVAPSSGDLNCPRSTTHSGPSPGACVTGSDPHMSRPPRVIGVRDDGTHDSCQLPTLGDFTPPRESPGLLKPQAKGRVNALEAAQADCEA